MSLKCILALAACLPLALAACSGGGASSAGGTGTQTPSGGTGSQTPAAALDAAKTAVAAANSAKTATAVASARRALSAAVEIASKAVETAQAALTKAQNYRTAQTDVLDGLQPIPASASLAAVKAASTPAAAAAAFAAAENAMAAARATPTAAAIAAARRALVAAVTTAQAALTAARSAQTEAQNYRTAQARAVEAIRTRPEPPPSGRSVVRLHGLAVTHLEMTDPYWSGENLSFASEDLNVYPQSAFRQEIVCPGVRPDGNVCTARIAIADGRRHVLPSVLDYGVAAYHASALRNVEFGSWDAPFYKRNSDGDRVEYDVEFFYRKHHSNCVGGECDSASPAALVRQSFGGKGRHSLFYTSTRNALGTYSAALGSLSAGRPRPMESETGGTASWSGPMFGTHLPTAASMTGIAELTVHFADNTVDVEMSGVREHELPGFTKKEGSYDGPATFGWENLEILSDASFFNEGSGNHRPDTDPDPIRGYIDGDFYGPNGEESAGVFERYMISGAWLAERGFEAEGESQPSTQRGGGGSDGSDGSGGNERQYDGSDPGSRCRFPQCTGQR